MDPSGKIAVVTGGASGIGRATAEALVAAGAEVVIWDAADTVEEVAGAIGARGLRVDIADADAVRAAAEDAGAIQLVAHCAAIGAGGPVWAVEDDVLDRVVDVNIRGTVFVLREAFRRMLVDGNAGRVVTVASANALVPDRGIGIYGASKAFVAQITRHAAAEMAEHGILVNAIAPGPTRTGMSASALADESLRRQFLSIPLKRVCEPSETAEAILFMLRSDWMTGETMFFDGGMQLAGPVDMWETMKQHYDPAVLLGAGATPRAPA